VAASDSQGRHRRSRTEPGFRAQQLGSALRGLAAELVDERRELAQLRRKVAELTLLLEGLRPTQGNALQVVPRAMVSE
jgi:hypothetical protein